MSEPFLGQITLFACNFAPIRWAQCQGQLLAISQNTALFSLLGTFYGGNGTTTFALPDLRGRVPLSQGQGAGLQPYVIGEQGGVETVTLLNNELPAHAHGFVATTGATTTATSNGNQLGVGQVGNPTRGLSKALIYSPGAVTTPLNPTSLSLYGTAGPHANIQPYLVLNYCISLVGIFPARG